MDLTRIKNPTEKDYQRIEKYRKAANKILDSLEVEGDEDFIERNYWSFGGGIKSIE